MRSNHGRPEARRRRRLWRFLSAAATGGAVIALAPAGCQEGLPDPIGGSRPTGQPTRGGTLRLASFQDIRGLDPAGPTDGLALQAEHLIFAGLVRSDERGRVVPELADHWDVSEGGRAYHFVLRPAVIMHDGEELTASDVKRSAERALHPTTPNPDASYFEGIVGYDAFVAARAEHLDGIAVEGRYDLTFHLKDPDASFLPLLAMHTLWPVCRSAGDRYSDRWHPCGAGPFKLAADGWRPGTSLELVRHERYFRPGLPLLDGVEWTFNMPLLAQRFRFEGGQIDLLRDITQADAARFASDPRWRALTTTETDTSVYGESMNTRMAPFDNVEVRRAVAAAVDREHYRLLKPGSITVLTQLLPPDAPGYDPTVHGQVHDLGAALEHMRRAGYPYDPATGRGGWPALIVYPLYDQGLLVATAQLLQQDLARIGLRIELKVVSFAAFLTLQERPGGAALSQANWQMDYPDPSSLFEPLFTSASIGPEVSYNAAFYSNPRFDDIVARARRELDEDRRRALYRDANAILCDEAPWAFAYSHHALLVRQGYLQGATRHPMWTVDVASAWIDRSDEELERRLHARGAPP